MNKAFKKHGKKSYSESYKYFVTDAASMFYGWEKRLARDAFDAWVDAQYRSAEDWLSIKIKQ